MLTNLIMRGVIKGEEWVAGLFISVHIRLPCGTVLSLPETLTHTHLQRVLYFISSSAHLSLATDKLGCTITVVVAKYPLQNWLLSLMLHF